MARRLRWAGPLTLAVLLLGVLGAALPDVAEDPLAPEVRLWAEEAGPLRVGWVDLAPVSIVEDGEVTGGWGVELLELAALKVGVDVTPVLYPTLDELVRALSNGEVDVIGILGPRPDVSAVAEATEPFGWAPIVIVVGSAREDAGAIADLAGGTVTTIPGSPLVEQIGDRYPDLEYVPTGSVPEGVAAVSAGDIDAYYGPLAIIGSVVQQSGGRDLRPLGEAAEITPVSAWALPGSPALELVRAARSLVTVDEMRVIHVRWTGFDLTDRSDGGVGVWVWRALAIAAALVLLLMVMSVVLRRRVASATTELRRYQDHLEDLVDERTEQLSRSNEALASFAASVAHDLRGPLAAAAGLAESLRLGILSDDRELVLERIEGASRRAAELVADMLRAAGSSSADTGRARSATEIEAWARELLGAEVDRRGARLSFHIEGDVVDAPDHALSQILVNLVDNALKYAGDEPSIDVLIRRAGDLWLVDVTDDGPGVPDALRELIFMDGVQGDLNAPGVGRGLARCRAIAAEHGGDLTYEPNPEGGSRFRATLAAPVGAPAGEPGLAPAT